MRKRYRSMHMIVLSVLIIAGASIQNASSTILFKKDSVQVIAKWKTAPFTIIGNHYNTVKLTQFSNVYAGAENSLTKICAEIAGLSAVKLTLRGDKIRSGTVKLKLSENSKLLIGIFRDSAAVEKTSFLTHLNFHGGKLNPEPVLKNALSITGLPAVDIYAVDYKKGLQEIEWTDGLFLIAGTISAAQNIQNRDAGFPDGRLWKPFRIDGFTAKALFEVTGGPDKPVVDEGMAGTEGIQGGFEGGACVKIGDTYHMFPTERAGQTGVELYYDRVKTRIGHWTSKDAIHWKRQATIYQASGNYSLTHDDNPLNDRRGAIWSYMPVFNEKANKWYGYYLTYTVDKLISPNHSFGRIWRTESEQAGREGIGGPYKDGVVIMEPGLDTQLWEGRQGVDSFYPYQAGKEWLALYGGAYPYSSWKDYPDKPGEGWFVGLAKADCPEGPWTRLDTTINPIRTIHPSFIENPIVYKLTKDVFITVFDGGPEGWGHHLPNMMGYSLSLDGYNWSAATYLPIETKVKKWWDIMRTPMCLIDEGNDIYTIVYAAINLQKRFHPLGKVQLKLNKDELEARIKELKK